MYIYIYIYISLFIWSTDLATRPRGQSANRESGISGLRLRRSQTLSLKGVELLGPWGFVVFIVVIMLLCLIYYFIPCSFCSCFLFCVVWVLGVFLMNLDSIYLSVCVLF